MDTIPDLPRLSSSDPAVVEAYAARLLAIFGLSDWTFAWDNAVRRLGLCDHVRRRISLSRFFAARNGPDAIADTIKHELAHAVVGRGHGHDETWKAMCRRIGCRPVRCDTAADMPAGRWRARCGSCGRRFHRHRRPRRVSGWFCRRCGRERGKLMWTVEGAATPTPAATDAGEEGTP